MVHVQLVRNGQSDEDCPLDDVAEVKSEPCRDFGTEVENRWTNRNHLYDMIAALEEQTGKLYAELGDQAANRVVDGGKPAATCRKPQLRSMLKEQVGSRDEVAYAKDAKEPRNSRSV